MTKYANLDGTSRGRFTLDKDGVIGIRMDAEGNVVLFDLQYGQATLAQMMEGGGGSIIENRGIITRRGGIVYSRPHTGGAIKLVVQQP